MEQKLYRPLDEVVSGVKYVKSSFADIVPKKESLKLCFSGTIWDEGPVYHDKTGKALFSDIPNNRILAYDPEDKSCTTWRTPSHYANGNTTDQEGRLVSCEQGTRRITRTEHDGSVTNLVDNYLGKKLNSPNDVVVKSDKTIWFSDPPYGIIDPTQGYALSESEIGKNLVFRFDPESGELSVVIDTLDRPNGLAFSPNEDKLYVSDTGKNPQVVEFLVSSNGSSLSSKRVFVTPSPGKADGLKVDQLGNLYMALWDGIHVFSPERELLGKILVPEQRTANLNFGGHDKKTLYITATRSLYSIKLGVKGSLLSS